ncbi:hypothetical protein C4577_07790 [Candidatus Parcubacteria bacterium]|nr:MAG: hypothetical protein C4577_07790 [Candidatus Parcubacteria bacterium]
MRLKQNENRLIWVDILKIFSIYLVVVIHSISPDLYVYLGERGSFFFQNILRSSVPLFVMLSGALLLGKNESFSYFYSKRVVKVLFPWVGWTVVYVIWIYFFTETNVDSLPGFIKLFYTVLFSKFWFMPMIFGLYLLTPVLRFVMKNKIYLLAVFLGWFLFVSLLPVMGKVLSFNFFETQLSTVQFLGYFLLGYFLAGVNHNNKAVFYSFLIFLVCFMLVSVVKSYFFSSLVSKLSPYPYNFISPVTVFVSSSIFLIFKGVTGAFEEKISGKIQERVALIGGLTLSIYLAHQVIAESVNVLVPEIRLLIYSVNPLVSTLFWALIIFVLSVLLILMLKKVPGIRRVV